MKSDYALCPKTSFLLQYLTRKIEFVLITQKKRILFRIASRQSFYIDALFCSMNNVTNTQLTETPTTASASASVGEMKKEPALEQIVDYLFEKAMVLLSRSLTSFVTNYFKAGVENFAIKYGTRPLVNISVDEYHKDGGYVARITATLTLPADVFERIRNRIRKEVYAKRADTTLKASILRKLIINELKSSTYGISDLLTGATETDNKVGRGGAEDGDKERRSDNQNFSQDNSGRSVAVEEYTE